MNSIQLLREKKLKITPQRTSILEVIKPGGHYTGEQIYNKIKSKVPGISLSTVYNTLNLLEKNSIISSFEVNGMKWYESRIDSHVNVYCEDRDKVTDLDLDLTFLLDELRKKGIVSNKISIVVYSDCKSDKVDLAL